MKNAAGASRVDIILCCVLGLLLLGGAWFVLSSFCFPWLGGPWLSNCRLFFAQNWIGPSLSFFGFWALVQMVLAIWVGYDASRRGMNGVLWGVLVFFTCVVGLVVYLIVAQTTAPGRQPAMATAGAATVAAPPAGKCASCGAALRADFRACPYCGAAVGGACPQCHRPVDPDWKFCSYCKAAL